MKRILYLVYYVRHMNWRTLGRFMRHIQKTTGMSKLRQGLFLVTDSLRYNISLLEWYQFGFVNLSHEQKLEWAGTGTMYEFQLRMNPTSGRDILVDKRKFFQAYREFCLHGLWSRDELQADYALREHVLARHAKLVFKDATGNCGASVRIVPTSELNASNLIEWMSANDYDMVESLIEQHPDLQALSPSGVNTVRIFTLLDRQGEYHVLGCRLRISINSPVDNLAAGNVAAPIDEETGGICGPGVYSDITREPERVHPVTGVAIVGFQIPFWQETLELVKRASLKHSQNRSVGWDVAVTAEGPELIEGNHDWCKLVWQLPVQRGLKSMLELA